MMLDLSQIGTKCRCQRCGRALSPFHAHRSFSQNVGFGRKVTKHPLYGEWGVVVATAMLGIFWLEGVERLRH